MMIPPLRLAKGTVCCKLTAPFVTHHIEQLDTGNTDDYYFFAL